MVDPNIAYEKLISLLDLNKVEYKLFSHKEALTWEDLAEVQKETGFFGTETKCMVLKAEDKFIVYVTTQGKRVNFDVQYDIFVDPRIYEQEWMLFSPVFPTKTTQVRGADLKKVFDSLENKVQEVASFNQG